MLQSKQTCFQISRFALVHKKFYISVYLSQTLECGHGHHRDQRRREGLCPSRDPRQRPGRRPGPERRQTNRPRIRAREFEAFLLN